MLGAVDQRTELNFLRPIARPLMFVPTDVIQLTNYSVQYDTLRVKAIMYKHVYKYDMNNRPTILLYITDMLGLSYS